MSLRSRVRYEMEETRRSLRPDVFGRVAVVVVVVAVTADVAARRCWHYLTKGH